MNLIDTGIEKGLIRFDEDKNYIKYIHQNKKRNYNNTEEKVQAIKKLEDQATLRQAQGTKLTKKEITEMIQADKSAVQAGFIDKVNLFKEELTEKYFLAKQTALDDYPIFMAIAEDIGYDATGRDTKNNERIEIGK